MKSVREDIALFITIRINLASMMQTVVEIKSAKEDFVSPITIIHPRHADMTETAAEVKDAREDTVLLITVPHKHADMMETV